jgi:ParB family chromosome partitioning protein
LKEIIDIPPDQIKDPEITRSFSREGFEDLKRSISSVGILQPLLIVKRENQYYLTAGRRRLLAAKELQITTVPCIIIEADHEQSLATTLHENLYREDMNAIDEANIFEYLSRKLRYSNKRIAQLISKSEPYVSQRMTILLWSDELKEALSQNKISFSVARELAMIDDPKVRKQYVEFASKQGINYRTAKSWRQQYELSKSTVPADTQSEQGDMTQSLETVTLGRCSNCKKTVPIPELTSIYLCEDCLHGKD